MKPADASWLDRKWLKLRHAQRMADRKSEAWNVLNDEVNDLIRRQPSIDHTDPNSVAKIKNENLGLKDAFAAWDFWQRECNRHATDLLAFKAIKELETFVVD
jgi:hypothetical protein